MPDKESAGYGMGIFGTTVRSIELLLLIIKTLDEAIHLKQECKEIKSVCATLLSILRSNSEVLQDVSTSKMLMETLEKVENFALDCKDESLLNCIWEVKWTKQLPALVKEMLMWIACLSTDLSVSVWPHVVIGINFSPDQVADGDSAAPS